MTGTNEATHVNAVIEKLLATLDAIVQDQAKRTAEALVFIRQGYRNAAIGTILDFDGDAECVTSLYRAAITLHRRAP